LAEAQKQNQQKQNASEAPASESISEREERIAEAEKRLEEREKTGEKTEAQKPPSASAASEVQKPEVREEKVEAQVQRVEVEEKPPEKVERFIELRLKGLGYREAVRASGLSGYMWDKWKGYIIKRLREAGLKEAESEEERIRKEAKKAEETIEKIVGGIPEEEKTEEMKTLDRLAANVEYARRIIPRIAYGYAYGEGKPVEKSEAPKVEEKKPEEKLEEKPREEGREGYPMLIPVKEIRYPDGKVEIQYTLGPEHYRVVRQTDMAVDKLVPELIGEIKETRKDISSIGNRLFTLIENYWGPQLKKIQPWTYFPIPITARTPAERERELAAYERQIAEKASPPPKAEAQAPKAETEEKKEKAAK
jgi:hypothetical protein